MKTEGRPDGATHVRLIVRVLQDMTRLERFSSYADLAATLKDRCASLRIFYDAGLITDAIDRLEEGGRRRLVDLPQVARRKGIERDAPDLAVVGKVDAAAILASIKANVKAMVPPADPNHEATVRRQAAVFSRVRPKRRPFTERLDEIFS